MAGAWQIFYGYKHGYGRYGAVVVSMSEAGVDEKSLIVHTQKLYIGVEMANHSGGSI